MDSPHTTLFYLAFGSILAACAGAIVLINLAPYIPVLKRQRDRIFLLGFGGLLMLPVSLQMAFLHKTDAVFLAILGVSMTLQGVFAANKRARGTVAGVGMMAAGLWLASAWLRSEDSLYELRLYWFFIGELLVIMGAGLTVAARHGWYPFLSVADDSQNGITHA